MSFFCACGKPAEWIEANRAETPRPTWVFHCRVCTFVEGATVVFTNIESASVDHLWLLEQLAHEVTGSFGRIAPGVLPEWLASQRPS